MGKNLTEPKTSIVIKFGNEENLKKLQQGYLYVCPLRKYVEDEKLQLGILDKNEGVSKCEIVKKRGKLKITGILTYRVKLDYPIFCLYRPIYDTFTGVYKIKYDEDIFSGYSHALVIDANKLYEKISQSCGDRYAVVYHDVVYEKCSKLIKAPFYKNEEFKKQNEVRYAFLDYKKYLGKDKEGIDTYGAPIIDINGEVFLNLGDLKDISKLVRKEELNGVEFNINN